MSNGAMTAVVFLLTLSAGLIGRAGLKAVFAAVGVAFVFRFAVNTIGDSGKVGMIFEVACLLAGIANFIAILMRRRENVDPLDPPSSEWWWPFGSRDDDD